MKIVICGSVRFRREILEAADKLRKEGHIVLAPILNTNSYINGLSRDLKRYAYLGLTLHHFELIRKADTCFIYNKGGYIGNSVTLELGAAVMRGLPIYALEEDKDGICRNILFDFVTGDVENFIKMISNKKPSKGGKE